MTERQLSPQFKAAVDGFRAMMEAAERGYGVQHGEQTNAGALITHCASVLAIMAAQSEEPDVFIASVCEMAVAGQHWARPFIEQVTRASGLEPLPLRERGMPN